MILTKPCPICKHGESTSYLSTYDDRYAYPGDFDLRKCARCDHIFLDACFTVNNLSNLYTNFYPRTSLSVDSFQPPKEMSALRSWLDGAKSGAYRWVPRGATVLDIGCGFCESLAYLTARGCKAVGVDVDANARRVAERYGFNVQIGLFEARLFEPGSFDYVTMSQVIEHAIDPIHTLTEIATVLKPNGIAVLSTPNPYGWGARIFGKRWINWHTPYHLQFFSPQSLALAAEQAGLKVLTSTTVTSSNWVIHQLVHLITCPKPGLPSSYWTKESHKPFLSRVTVKLIAATRLLLVPQLLSRLFDVLQIGDNRVILLQKGRDIGGQSRVA